MHGFERFKYFHKRSKGSISDIFISRLHYFFLKQTAFFIIIWIIQEIHVFIHKNVFTLSFLTLIFLNALARTLYLDSHTNTSCSSNPCQTHFCKKVYLINISWKTQQRRLPLVLIWSIPWQTWRSTCPELDSEYRNHKNHSGTLPVWTETHRPLAILKVFCVHFQLD